MPLFFASAQRLLAVSQDCALCGERNNAVVCVPCSGLLPALSTNCCPQCSAEATAHAASEGQICGTCLREPPLFDAAVAAYRYAFPVDRLLQSFKFNANLALVDLFADALAERVRSSGPPSLTPRLIVPLPLAPKRLAARGFNQAALIATRVARGLQLPIERAPLLRIRETPPQAGLARDARRKNVKGAFACDQGVDLSGVSIAIVDDVMTTGATLSEAARALKAAGASRVEAWVVSRATIGPH